MRVAWIVVASACASPRPPPLAIENHAPLVDREPREIPIDTTWQLAGSVHVASGELRLDFCCTRSGTARHPLPEVVAGTWDLEIAHVNTECSQGTIAIIAPADNDNGSLYADVARLAGGITKLHYVAEQPLELRLLADGGLHCCGTTIVRSIVARRID